MKIGVSIAIVAIVGLSIAGSGIMTSYQDNIYNWFEKFSNFWDLNQFVGYLWGTPPPPPPVDQSPIKHATVGLGIEKKIIFPPAPPPPPSCPQDPIVSAKELTPGGDVEVTYKQSLNVNDNSYGVNAIGWGTKGHTFKDLHNSDNLQFQFKDSKGNVVLDFHSDYITAISGDMFKTPDGVDHPTPSHYFSLGPFGGDGSFMSGDSKWVKSWDSSFAQNLNNNPWFVNGVQTPATKSVADLLINSPPTNPIGSYNPVVPFGAWKFINEYKVIISADAFPGGFVAGKYSVSFPSIHNSPAKKCPAPPPPPPDNGQPFFQNVITQCQFHSTESFNPLCIECKFFDIDNKLIATGKVEELSKPYTASDLIPIEMSPVPVESDTPSNDVQDVQDVTKVKLEICGPKCECIKPTKFTIRYDGPKDGVKVKIFKTIKNNAPNGLVFTLPGTFDSGKNITIDSRDWGQNMVNPETVYAFYKYDKLIGYVKIDTSCKKGDLFIGDMFFFKKGTSDQIKLTVVSGFTSDGKPAIPPSSCKKEEPGFFVGGGRVNVPKNGGSTFILTHGFELHCDPALGPNNLEINWPENKFHLEELEKTECVDDGSPNEPPPSPHPGPTLDVYYGNGYGRYNGECGAFAEWVMDDNGEPGKADQIVALKITGADGKIKLNINENQLGVRDTSGSGTWKNPGPKDNPLWLNLETGNHQWVPHPATHPKPPTQTTPCPEMTP